MFKSTTIAKKRSLPSKPRWKPHKYQLKAVKFLLEHGAAALFLDPGLGKTSVTLAAYKMLKSEKLSRGMLVVAPLRPAQTVWPKELAKWPDFAGLDLVVLHSDSGGFKQVYEQHDVYVINYEGLSKLFARERRGKVWHYFLTDLGKELLRHVDTLVWDELSKMKHADTLRYKLVKPWLKKFLRRWGLTGSPAANGLLDLFGQCYVLDEGNALGAFITHYRTAYFQPVGKSGFMWAPSHGAEEAIHKRLRPLALRMEGKDYLELPQQMDHTIKLDMPPKVRAQYVELEEELLTLVDDELIVATNAAAANSKCRQICSGALYMPTVDALTGAVKQRKSDRQVAILHDTKLDALEELIEELQGQQLLIAYDFNHDLQRLQKRFPGVPHIGGGVSAKEGIRLEAAWNKGEIINLFVHPASVGHGLNLQESNAAHIAWFTLTWDFELYDQLNQRIRRQGNKSKHVHCYQFVMKDSVEESVAYTLRSKNRTQKALLDALKTKKRVEDGTI